ncbi:MAG: hypothetical protein AAGG59_03235 [Bacteroidota bacterium]
MATKASEELLAAPLPKLIEGIGLSVAKANNALNEAGEDIDFVINEGEVELNVAITVDTTSQLSGSVEFGLSAFSINASYSKTYSFKEEASSRILLKFTARPRIKAAEPE